MMLRFYGDQLAAANPGLDESLLVASLTKTLDILDESGPESLNEWRYPEPDEPHPAGHLAQIRKITQAQTRAGANADLHAGPRIRPGRRLPPPLRHGLIGRTARSVDQSLRIPQRRKTNRHRRTGGKCRASSVSDLAAVRMADSSCQNPESLNGKRKATTSNRPQFPHAIARTPRRIIAPGSQQGIATSGVRASAPDKLSANSWVYIVAR
ncbi:MAG: hypothetical protein R3C99_22445 [Pirellulaceae bacterium]